MLDETGGKPLTGYGSGANTGSPVATPEQSAENVAAQTAAIQADAKKMCWGGGYAFRGEFCQAAIHEVSDLRRRATLLTHKPSLRNAVRPAKKAADVGIRLGLGLTTAKGVVYAIGVPAFAGATVAFGAVTVISGRACWTAAKLEKGLAGLELAASTCPFVAGTLVEGTMLSGVFTALSGYAWYQEGDRQLRRLRGRGR